MSTNKVALTVLAGWLALGSSGTAAAGIVQMKDSADFEHYYEGGDPVISGNNVSLDVINSGYAGTLGGATLTSVGDVLTHNTPIVGGGTNFPNALWNAQADDAGGWAWEMEYRMDPGNDSTRPAFQIRIGDKENTDHAIFRLYTGKIDIYSAGTIIANGNFTQGFHTFRIAQDAGSNLCETWVDGVPAASVTGTYSGANHWMGDGSGFAGGTTYIDYIRWTGNGGFAPVPEPSSLVLLVLGLVAVAGWRKRK